MYHSQSQTPQLTWAREEAEEAIYAGGGTLHPVCSHYAQAGGECPLNGVGNPSLSIFLWPLYDEGLQSNEALGDFVSSSRPVWREGGERWRGGENEGGVRRRRDGEDKRCSSRKIDSDGLALPPRPSPGLPFAGLVGRVGLQATRETFFFFFQL